MDLNTKNKQVYSTALGYEESDSEEQKEEDPENKLDKFKSGFFGYQGKKKN